MVIFLVGYGAFLFTIFDDLKIGGGPEVTVEPAAEVRSIHVEVPHYATLFYVKGVLSGECSTVDVAMIETVQFPGRFLRHSIHR